MHTTILTIRQDPEPMNPRKEFDNLGTMVCWHRRYNLGDLQPKESPGEWRKENLPKKSIEFPLYLYDHSGITMNTTGYDHCDMQRWDWGQVGFIFCPPDRIRKEYGRVTKKTLEKVKEVLLGEVKVYDQYLRGAVWGYEYSHGRCQVEDSCWGFFGDTLEETGIIEALPPAVGKGLIEHAWENRA